MAHNSFEFESVRRRMQQESAAKEAAAALARRNAGLEAFRSLLSLPSSAAQPKARVSSPRRSSPSPARTAAVNAGVSAYGAELAADRAIRAAAEARAGSRSPSPAAGITARSVDFTAAIPPSRQEPLPQRSSFVAGPSLNAQASPVPPPTFPRYDQSVRSSYASVPTAASIVRPTTAEPPQSPARNDTKPRRPGTSSGVISSSNFSAGGSAGSSSSTVATLSSRSGFAGGDSSRPALEIEGENKQQPPQSSVRSTRPTTAPAPPSSSRGLLSPPRVRATHSEEIAASQEAANAQFASLNRVPNGYSRPATAGDVDEEARTGVSMRASNLVGGHHSASVAAASSSSSSKSPVPDADAADAAYGSAAERSARYSAWRARLEAEEASKAAARVSLELSNSAALRGSLSTHERGDKAGDDLLARAAMTRSAGIALGLSAGETAKPVPQLSSSSFSSSAHCATASANEAVISPSRGSRPLSSLASPPRGAAKADLLGGGGAGGVRSRSASPAATPSRGSPPSPVNRPAAGAGRASSPSARSSPASPAASTPGGSAERKIQARSVAGSAALSASDVAIWAASKANDAAQRASLSAYEASSSASRSAFPSAAASPAVPRGRSSGSGFVSSAMVGADGRVSTSISDATTMLAASLSLNVPPLRSPTRPSAQRSPARADRPEHRSRSASASRSPSPTPPRAPASQYRAEEDDESGSTNRSRFATTAASLLPPSTAAGSRGSSSRDKLVSPSRLGASVGMASPGGLFRAVSTPAAPPEAPAAVTATMMTMQQPFGGNVPVRQRKAAAPPSDPLVQHQPAHPAGPPDLAGDGDGTADGFRMPMGMMMTSGKKAPSSAVASTPPELQMPAGEGDLPVSSFSSPATTTTTTTTKKGGVALTFDMTSQGGAVAAAGPPPRRKSSAGPTSRHSVGGADAEQKRVRGAAAVTTSTPVSVASAALLAATAADEASALASSVARQAQAAPAVVPSYAQPTRASLGGSRRRGGAGAAPSAGVVVVPPAAPAPSSPPRNRSPGHSPTAAAERIATVGELGVGEDLPPSPKPISRDTLSLASAYYSGRLDSSGRAILDGTTASGGGLGSTRSRASRAATSAVVSVPASNTAPGGLPEPQPTPEVRIGGGGSGVAGVSTARATSATTRATSASRGTLRRSVAPPAADATTVISGGSLGGPGHHTIALPVAAKASNKKRVANALQTVCLAGSHRTLELAAALRAMEAASAGDPLVLGAAIDSAGGAGTIRPCDYFLVLLAAPESLSYKGLYAFDPQTCEAIKIHGSGPSFVTDAVLALLPSNNPSGGPGSGGAVLTSARGSSGVSINGCYKYSTGQRRFEALPTLSVGLTTDAITVKANKRS
jgi:trimeric autotransporter adhesin